MTALPALILAAAIAASAAPPRVARGTTGSVEIASDAPLRAKALRDAASPVLVRVNAAGPGRYRVEFIGTVEGAYDLAPLLERADGRAAEGLPDLRVEVFSQLPPNHGTDVFGLGADGFSIAAHYSLAMTALVAAWAAVPGYFVVRRLMRRRPEPPGPAAHLVLVGDGGERGALEARARELDARERGRLELLLLRELRGGDAHASLADAIAALRDDARTAAVVRAVEAWLHAPTAGDRAQALDAIDRLRAAEKGMVAR